MRLVAASWHPVWHAEAQGWFDRYRRALCDIGANRDTLVVFPEYAALEAAFYGPQDVSEAGWMIRGADHFEAYCEGIAELVAETGATILGGSGFAYVGDTLGSGIVNRAMFCAPEGVQMIEKRMPTPYERALGLCAGQVSPVLETRFGRIACLICYDSEFPLLARIYSEAGAELLLVPSCTDTWQGASRVEIGCRARALEGQMIVAMAPLTGTVTGCDVVDINHGQPAVFCPPDTGAPEDGILARGPRDSAGFAVLDHLETRLATARAGGQVSVKSHWPESEIGGQSHEIRALSAKND
nr:nitrilase-related carbon-nitrogen hydrolase [uncultured Celeribacter sp.]